MLLFLYCGGVFGQSNFYSQQVQLLNGDTFSLRAFEGKKILIASVSPENLYGGQDNYLDSIQTANPSIVVIVIPALDFGGDRNGTIVDSLKNKTGLKILITTATYVTQASGNMQDALMNWLTHFTGNTHFNQEVTTDTNFYVISTKGELQAVLDKTTPSSVIDLVINQTEQP